MYKLGQGELKVKQSESLHIKTLVPILYPHIDEIARNASLLLVYLTNLCYKVSTTHSRNVYENNKYIPKSLTSSIEHVHHHFSGDNGPEGREQCI